MIYIERMIRAYGYMIRQTADTVKKAPLALAIVPVASILLVAFRLMGMRILGVTQWGYFVLQLLESAAISFVLSACFEAVSTKRLTFKKLHIHMFEHYLFSVYFVRVICALAARLMAGIQAPGILFLQGIIFLFLSPIPETLYLEHSYGFRIGQDIWNYLKRNWYVWILPILLLSSFLGTYDPWLGAIRFGQNMMMTEIFRPFAGMSLYPLTVPNITVGLIQNILFSLYVLARGHLFVYTRLGNARKDANRY